jgi:hypothetical protein
MTEDAAATTHLANQDVELRSGRLRIQQGAVTAEGDGQLVLTWLPTPRIRFRGEVGGLLTPDGEVTVAFAVNRRRAAASGVVERASIRPTNRGLLITSVEGFFTEPVAVGAGRDLSAVEFGVVNFPQLEGTFTTVAGDWTVTLAPAANRGVFDDLRRAGGYAVTAAGLIERSDGRTFSARAAQDFVDMLGTFLAFASGAWSPVVLLEGADGAGTVVWNEWWVGPASGWQTRHRWFPVRSQQAGLDLLGAWNARWSNPYWRHVLRFVTYLLVDANSGNADLGLITAQSALETLGWAYGVLELSSMPKSDFNNPRIAASTKLRALLTAAGIATAIPAELASLVIFAPAPGFVDGPDKLTWLRNRLVHPVQSAPTAYRTLETIDAWSLAVWYLEAVLLHLLHYSGTVWDRSRSVYRLFP